MIYIIVLWLTQPSRFASLQVEVGVYYGGQGVSKRAYSPRAKPSRDFFDCVVWDKW